MRTINCISFIGLLCLSIFGASAGAECPANMHFQGNSLISSDPIISGADSTLIIPFSRAGNLIILTATVDTVRGNFILDTGAPGLVLNITYFRQYEMVTHSDQEQAGLSGLGSNRQTTTIKSLRLDNILFERIDADMISLGHLENSKGIKILGLLGVEVFKRLEMMNDYENNLHYLHKIPKKQSKSYISVLFSDPSKFETLSFDLVENKIITKMDIGGRKLRFIVDCGAESNLLDSRLPNSVFDNVQVNRRVKLVGAGSQKLEALAGDLNNLQAGTIKIDGLPVMVTNLEKSCLSFVNCTDGILGFDFLSLHKIGFNFVKREMYIWK